jgi:hypothetical protein
MLKAMRKELLAGLLLAAALLPSTAFAATIDARLIPDGTYVVKVEKVQDPAHVLVVMQNGVETTLAARNTINFLSVKPNDTLKISLIKGMVPVFRVQ